jgi:hypothetical protein
MSQPLLGVCITIPSICSGRAASKVRPGTDIQKNKDEETPIALIKHPEPGVPVF